MSIFTGPAPVTPYPHFSRRTPAERFQEDMEATRAELNRWALRRNFEKLMPFTYGAEKTGNKKALHVLDLGGFDERAVERMLSVTSARLKSLPAPPQSLQFRAMTRAAGNRTMKFIASTDSIDRHKTRILPMGIQTDTYMSQNPVVGFQHQLYGGLFSQPDPKNVIGRTIRLEKNERQLLADIEFLPASVNDRAELIFQQLQLKALNSVSIGFIPLDVTIEMVNGEQIPTIRRSELLEISVVAIPSQSDAVAQGRAKR